LWITGELAAAVADFELAESDLSLEVLDFSDEPDLSLLLDPSVLDVELVLADPLTEFFADSRLSVR
jgi:hypothetical protein